VFVIKYVGKRKMKNLNLSFEGGERERESPLFNSDACCLSGNGVNENLFETS